MEQVAAMDDRLRHLELYCTCVSTLIRSRRYRVLIMSFRPSDLAMTFYVRRLTMSAGGCILME